LSKRALPLLTGGLNELTRSDLIDDSQLQQCDNYEVVGDGTLRKRKDTSVFDTKLDEALFGTGVEKQTIVKTNDNGTTQVVLTTDYGLFGEGSLLKISEPYYYPTDIDLTNSDYSTLQSDYILLVYGITSGSTYQMHMLYKADGVWTKYAIYNEDGTKETLSDLLTDAGIIYTSASDPQFAFADDKVIIADGVNNSHYVAIDLDGIARAGKMGLPAPRNRAKVEQMTSVDKALFETDTTQTYISAPSLVQLTYTAVTKFGDESNPAPLSTTLDMQYNKIGEDGITSHYIDKVKVHDLTVPDVPENVMETVKYFNFYMRVVPYKAGIEVGALIFTEQQEINTKTKSGTETGNSYVLTLPPLGDTASYENDVAPIAETAAQLGGITMLGNVQDNVKFPWKFKYFHAIKISNKDSASYVDGNFILRLYDKDADHDNAIENLDLDEYISSTLSTDATFGNTAYFRFFDEDLSTPLYCAFVKGENGIGKPASYKTIDSVYGTEPSSQYGLEYVDLIVQVPYMTANLTRTIYLCWSPEAYRETHTGVDDDYDALITDDSSWEGSLGIHYGKVMNINSDPFIRQQFFKGSMLDNDQTYISYPIELTFEGYMANRANINNQLFTGSEYPYNITTGINIVDEGISKISGFKVVDKWTNRINTSTDSVGEKVLKFNSIFSGAFIHGDQFDGASLDEQAGWVSFMFDAIDSHEVTGYARPQSDPHPQYSICTIWGESPDASNPRKAIRLFAQLSQNAEGTYTSDHLYWSLYLDNHIGSLYIDDKYFLGEDFVLYDSTSTIKSQRYFLITWDNNQSEVTIWSGNNDGNIVFKTIDPWDLKGVGVDENTILKITDGEFKGITLGTIRTTRLRSLIYAKYNDIQMQLGEYLDPENENSRARFANIMNQFPAYDNFIGYKHAVAQEDVTYNNNISFTETEFTDVKPRKNMVRWSDINRNSFPDLYFKSVREPIMKIVPAPSFLREKYQNTFLIYTRNSINRFILEGSASGWQGSSSSLIEERTQYGLYAPESLVRIGETLFWLSEVGVIMWDSEGLRLISKNIINVDISKTYFGFENSINNQYILAQKTPDNELYVYHVDRNLWTKFNNMGHGSLHKSISQAVSLTGGSQTDNINLIYGHDGDKHIYQYPASAYTSEASTIQTKEMFFEKGILRRVKAGYTGDDKLFSSILIKDDVDRSEITKTHTVAMEANKWRGIPLGYNRGKSVVFQIDNADTIESIMYDLDIHAEVTV